MNFTNLEKIALVILSILFLIGAVSLHIRQTSTRHEITIIENGIKEQFTLEEIEERLKKERRVSINTATARQLIAIPGIGETLAGRIIEYRQRQGPFRTITDLLNIEGIGEKKLNKIKLFIKIE